MIGIGYRRDMRHWDMSSLCVDFVEVAPENWLRCNRDPLHALQALGLGVRLHGVSLNLGGHSEIDRGFVRSIRDLMDELGTPHYSDHLAASGDAHHLYDLFPIDFTDSEMQRVSDRIARVQDLLGQQIAVENSTWYTQCGSMRETDFIAGVLARADCRLLLDLNNVVVNHKNHRLTSLDDVVNQLDLSRISYLHVAGHEFNPALDMFIDTHSRPVETATAEMARKLQDRFGFDVLLEWDHDIPGIQVLNQEIACLRCSTTTFAT